MSLAHMANFSQSFGAMARKNTSGLARDIEIVELLADTAEALGVSTIARRLNRDLTQISRALATLAEAGIVRRDPVSRGYLVGWRLAVLAGRTLEERLAEIARPHIRSLASTLNETAMLSVSLKELGFGTVEEVTTAEETLVFALPPELRRDLKAASAEASANASS